MNPAPALLQLSGLRKSFPVPDGGRKMIIDVAGFTLGPGEHLALRGESGSGKTTFLNLIAGILAPDEGSILIDGSNMAALREHRRDRLRAAAIGYIFQTFNLLQGYTCLENVMLGMTFGARADKGRALELLERVGLSDRLRHRPRQLSSGQQQRVAVARALAKRPKLVLADEPTGNLDRRNSREALELIRETCRESGAALLLVSHDPDVLGGFQNVREFSELNLCLGESAP
jgi:putative ABC transport system ATP-binding protein